MAWKRKEWMMVALVLFGGLSPLEGGGIGEEEWTVLNSSWFEPKTGGHTELWCSGIMLDDPIYALSVADQWKNEDTNRTEKPPLRNVTLTKTSARLWTSMLYHKCTGEALINGGSTKEWCWFAEMREKLEPIAAIKCWRYSVVTSLKTWFDRTKDTRDKVESSTVHFNLYAPENSSWRCPGESNTTADNKMPTEDQNISGLSCTRMDPADENTTKPPKDRKKCFYTMTWLDDTVGYYSCDVRNASNCEETIRDEFEEGREGSFKATVEPIEEGQGTEAHTDWKTRSCTPKAESQLKTDTELKKFNFTDDGISDKAEIWCALPMGDSANTIKCELLTPCQVTIKEGFNNQEKQIGIETKISYEKKQNEPAFPDKCSLQNPQPDTESIKILKFNGNTEKGQIWCAFTGGDSGGSIKCKYLTQCEVAVREKLNGAWMKDGNEIGIDYKGGGHTSPQNCSPKENPTGGSTIPKFKIDGGRGSEQGEFWCIPPGEPDGKDKITCRPLSPCEVAVGEQFEGGCKGCVVKGEIVYQGEETSSKLPLVCASADGSQSLPSSGSNKTFKIMDPPTNPPTDPPGRRFSCKAERTKISCTVLPRTCQEEVQKEYKECRTTGTTVNFGSNASFLSNKGGAHPTDNCPLATITGAPKSCQNNGNHLEFKITSEIEQNLKGRRISCRVENGGIECDLLPRTCDEYVRHEFKENCEKSTEALTVKYEEKANFSAIGGVNLADFCPLEHFHPKHPKHQGICKDKRGNSLVFKIANGTNENRDVLCNFTNSGISCSLVGLTCAQEIQSQLLKYYNHSEKVGNLVEIKDKEELKLNKATCNKTEEEYGNGRKVFDVQGTGNKTEILCQNGEGPISCRLLPPRCEINNFGPSEERPLRCDKKQESITISSAKFEKEEKIECGNNEPKDNTERNETCEINVTKVGEKEGNAHFYCDKEKAKDLRSACTPLTMLRADNCALQNLTFPNRSECKINGTGLSIPRFIYAGFQKELRNFRDHCNLGENTHKQAENKCLMTITNDNNEKYYHCNNDIVTKLQEKLSNLCHPAEIPSHLHHSPSSRNEPVTIQFQSEEHHTEETNEVKKERIQLINKVTLPSDPWEDYDENLTSFSHFPFASPFLLALF